MKKKVGLNRASALRAVGKEGKKWTNFRRKFLKARAEWFGGWICQRCKRECLYVEVDHIKKRSTNPELKYEVSNLQILCKPCHHKETQKKL